VAELVDAIHNMVQGLRVREKVKSLFATKNNHLQVRILSRTLKLIKYL